MEFSDKILFPITLTAIVNSLEAINLPGSAMTVQLRVVSFLVNCLREEEKS